MAMDDTKLPSGAGSSTNRLFAQRNHFWQIPSLSGLKCSEQRAGNPREMTIIV
jgi:hypothetical protein